MSSSVGAGELVAVLETRDSDRVDTCLNVEKDADCPCAHVAFAIEAGNDDGLFELDTLSGRLMTAAQLANHDGRQLKLYVSVVNRGLDATEGDDVRGPKNYGTLTIVVGKPQSQPHFEAEDSAHVRHKRVRLFYLLTYLLSLHFTL